MVASRALPPPVEVEAGAIGAVVVFGASAGVPSALVATGSEVVVFGVLTFTGGLASDVGLLEATREELAKAKVEIEVVNHPQSILAGAIGAGLWGAFRHEKLLARAT